MTQSMATELPRAASERRRRFLVHPFYECYFPASEYKSYDAFLNTEGETFKSEPRTRIVIVRRRSSAAEKETIRSFVLKIYYYPLLPRIRTGLRISKAEQEFNSLHYLHHQGVSGTEAVAFGVERTRLGFVRSCFVITAFVEGAVNLSQWRAENKTPTSHAHHSHFLLKQLGAVFHRLHETRFFLFTSKTKNLLIHREWTRAPEFFVIDVPYARTLRWRPIARWAQGRDLGLLLANFDPALSHSETTAFYDGYLPDPLGGSAMALRGYAEQTMRAKQNLTLISALVHRFKRSLRKKLTAWKLWALAHVAIQICDIFDVFA